jgi:ankyrin repeat protein
MKLLLAAHAAVDAADAMGQTALHKAAMRGEEAAMQLLLEAEAAVDAPDAGATQPCNWQP